MILRALMMSLCTMVLCTSCLHTFPLAPEPTMKVNPKLLGLWQDTEKKEDGAEKTASDRMQVVKWNDQEYMLLYPSKSEKGLYFRAYTFDIEGRHFVQLQIVGPQSHLDQRVNKNFYTVAEYKLVGDKLHFGTINMNFMDDETDPEKFKAGFKKHFKHPSLFNDMQIYERYQIPEPTFE